MLRSLLWAIVFFVLQLGGIALFWIGSYFYLQMPCWKTAITVLIGALCIWSAAIIKKKNS